MTVDNGTVPGTVPSSAWGKPISIHNESGCSCKACKVADTHRIHQRIIMAQQTGTSIAKDLYKILKVSRWVADWKRWSRPRSDTNKSNHSVLCFTNRLYAERQQLVRSKMHTVNLQWRFTLIEMMVAKTRQKPSRRLPTHTIHYQITQNALPMTWHMGGANLGEENPRRTIEKFILRDRPRDSKRLIRKNTMTCTMVTVRCRKKWNAPWDEPKKLQEKKSTRVHLGLVLPFIPLETAIRTRKDRHKVQAPMVSKLKLSTKSHIFMTRTVATWRTRNEPSIVEKLFEDDCTRDGKSDLSDAKRDQPMTTKQVVASYRSFPRQSNFNWRVILFNTFRCLSWKQTVQLISPTT